MEIKMDQFKRKLVCAFVAAMLFAFVCAPSPAGESQIEELARRAGITVIAEATSDNDVLNYTKARIPYDKMSPAAQQRAAVILNDISQFRRMPSLQYEVDTNMYQYLINHPDVSVSTWRAMGISTLKMWQTDRFEYEAKASDGSEGIADVLWRDANQCLFIVEGKYSSPILPAAIQASALVWLQYRFVTGENGKPVVNQQVETFVHFPSSAIDTIAKLASRVTNTILDRNIFEVSLYARMMSQAAEKDPDWIAQLAQQLDDVSPQRKLELVQVAHRFGTPNSIAGPLRGRLQPNSPGGFRSTEQFQAFDNSFRSVETQTQQVDHVSLHDGSQAALAIGAGSETDSNSSTGAAQRAGSGVLNGARAQKTAGEYRFYSASSTLPDQAFAINASSLQLSSPSIHGPTRATVDELMPSPVRSEFIESRSDRSSSAKASHGQYRVSLSEMATLPTSEAARQGDSKASDRQPAISHSGFPRGSGPASSSRGIDTEEQLPEIPLQ